MEQIKVLFVKRSVVLALEGDIRTEHTKVGPAETAQLAVPCLFPSRCTGGEGLRRPPIFEISGLLP